MGVEKVSPALRETRDSPIPSSSSGDYAPPAWPSSDSSVSTNLALSASRIHRQTRGSLESGGAFAGRPAWNRWIRGVRRVFRRPSKLYGRRKSLAGLSGNARFADTFVVLRRLCASSLESGGAFAGRPAWNRWIRGVRRVFRRPSKLYGRRKSLAGPSGNARFAGTFVVLRRLCASRVRRKKERPRARKWGRSLRVSRLAGGERRGGRAARRRAVSGGSSARPRWDRCRALPTAAAAEPRPRRAS